jgi:hypothetical protein
MRPKRGINSVDGWSSRFSKGGEIGMVALLKVAFLVLGVII